MDYDGVNENVLLDLTIAGRPRKVLVQFNRNATPTPLTGRPVRSW